MTVAVGVTNELACRRVHVVGVGLDRLEARLGGGRHGLPLSRGERIGARGRTRHEGAAQRRQARLRGGRRGGRDGTSFRPHETRSERDDHRGDEHEQRPKRLERRETSLRGGPRGHGPPLIRVVRSSRGSVRRGARRPPDARGASRHDIPFSTRSSGRPSRGRKDWSDAKCDSGGLPHNASNGK